MRPLFDAPLAIVDVETTGAHPVYDRVTEIAVIEAEGGEITSQWSTLVDPETTIPAAIQALTGITDAMVAGAPTFGGLAEGLYERLAGRVLVAHNARFDYSFLRHEFERAGLRFTARTLCTVKLSRRLYPQHARHNLDAVMARHNLACSARHRALGDAEVVWQFLLSAGAERGEEALAHAARLVAKQPTLPAHIDRSIIDAIPDEPGVYLFHGEGGAPLYVGKSVAMRTRVLSHFADDVRSTKEMQLAREVRTIEWQRTAGELGALLREAELVTQLLPVYNRRLRRAADLCSFSLASPSELRLVAALAGMKTAAWPWRGPVGVIEADRESDATEVHVIDHWCYLGTAKSDAEVGELLEGARLRFDFDQYKLLVRHLRRPGVRTIPLSSPRTPGPRELSGFPLSRE
jgi:DNA polymerase-3 subunit epsilon